MKNNKILIFVSMFLIVSCIKFGNKDDKLTLAKQTYNGNELKIKGYYITEYVPNYFTVYFFYNNGVLLYGSSFHKSELSRHEIMYSNGYHYLHSKNIKYYWGLFNINDSIILFEHWNPSEPPLRVYTRKGRVLNDSTFIIYEFYRTVDGKKVLSEVRNDVYHFKPFSPKPDSINSFVP